MYSQIKIGIIGFGSVGKQLYNMLLECDFTTDQIYVFADDMVHNEEERKFPFSAYQQASFKDLQFIPALGYLSKNLRCKVLDYLTANNYQIFSFIHPTAFVSKTAAIGKGVIVYSMCNIDQGAIIEDGVIMLNGVTIAHDSKIGKCSYLAPGVCLSGLVTIEPLCFIGTGATIANNVVVGKNSIVGIGTCLTRNIPEESSVIGNPFQSKKITLV